MGRVAVLEARLGIQIENKDEENFDLFGSDEVCCSVPYIV